jgi:hypothetical protein
MIDFVVVGSGPSLTADDCAHARRAHGVIVVNDSYRMMRNADFLYARDYDWWASIPRGFTKPNHELARETFMGKMITGSERAAREYGLLHAHTRQATGIGTTGVIHEGGSTGCNSGYQAINLAIQYGAGRVLLLGFDMGAGHWFGEHPAPLTTLQRDSDYTPFIAAFKTMLPDLADLGVEVVNCSRQSRLPWFRRSTIDVEI